MHKEAGATHKDDIKTFNSQARDGEGGRWSVRKRGGCCGITAG
jgi:hypothetical protein